MFNINLKNTGGYKYSQLKGKTYEEIHGLYERQQKRNQDFIPMDTEVINDSGKNNDSSSKPVGGLDKRGTESAKSMKKQAADYDLEKWEREKKSYELWLTIV
ncbi:hypothetical protein Tco_0639313 [Tanacetum coccineum]